MPTRRPLCRTQTPGGHLSSTVSQYQSKYVPVLSSSRFIASQAVYGADWTASYDIRVNTQAKEKNMTVLYKAIVS